jgi:hypothetical protein
MTQKPPNKLSTSMSTAGSDRSMMNEEGEDKASEIAATMKDRAGQVAEQAREQVGGQVASQKDRAAEGLGSMAMALRQTSSQMREENPSSVPGYIEKAADQVERLSGYLQGHTVGDLVGGVERFARREPMLFLGSAFALGLLGARFLKSSSPRRSYGRGRDYERSSRYREGRFGEDRYGEDRLGVDWDRPAMRTGLVSPGGADVGRGAGSTLRGIQPPLTTPSGAAMPGSEPTGGSKPDQGTGGF